MLFVIRERMTQERPVSGAMGEQQFVLQLLHLHEVTLTSQRIRRHLRDPAIRIQPRDRVGVHHHVLDVQRQQITHSDPVLLVQRVKVLRVHQRQRTVRKRGHRADLIQRGRIQVHHTGTLEHLTNPRLVERYALELAEP